MFIMRQDEKRYTQPAFGESIRFKIWHNLYIQLRLIIKTNKGRLIIVKLLALYSNYGKS